MDQESVVYGCIRDVANLAEDPERRRCNRQAMQMLPAAEDWPILCREMFSVPDLALSGGQYLADVVHFGASYRAIEYEWSAWMERFEQLLDQMYWVSAVVHLETELFGTHTFIWQSKNNGHQPGAGRKAIHCEWTQEKIFV